MSQANDTPGPRGGAAQTEIDRTVDALASQLSNWGRWGSDDACGTLNFITAAKRLEAAACVRTGETISLATPLQSRWPQVPGSGRLNCQHFMHWSGADSVAEGGPVGYADDAITMSVHGHTHWDALSHISHRGKMWGGVTAAAVDGRGAHRNDILPLANVMASRGVLLDLPEPGADALPPDHEVTSSELERALERQRVELRSGDVLLIRTGHLGKTRRTGQWADYVEVDGVLPVEPGIGAESLAWLSDREVAAVACDNFGVEVMRGAETRRLPVHEVGLVYMGLFLGENFDLDLLADRCAGDGRWDFLLVAPALPIEGAVGGPVSPMAVR